MSKSLGGSRGVLWPIPQNEILGFLRDRNFWRKCQSFFPVHHLLICLLRGLRTERWVACNKKGTSELLHPRTWNLTEVILLNTILCIFNDLVCPSLHEMDRIFPHPRQHLNQYFGFPKRLNPQWSCVSGTTREHAKSWSWEKKEGHKQSCRCGSHCDQRRNERIKHR